MERLLRSRRWETAREGVAKLALAFAVAGCADVKRDDARTDAALPEDIRLITLTLWPFHELPEDENGFGEQVSIGGVEVCVAFKRAYGQAWNDFVETNGPCSEPTVANENVVLHNVPGPSELIITARKEGFRSSLFAVTTWQFDLDVTAGSDGIDKPRLSLLRRADSKTARVEPTVVVDPKLGDLSFYARACPPPPDGGSGCGSPEGILVSLDPDAGDGPYYFSGGRFVPDATRTVSGEFEPASRRAGASFVNLRGNEYFVRTAHPHAFCRAAGRDGRDGDPIYGFARPGGVIGAPVLEGFSTPAILAGCDCLNSAGLSGLTPADWRDCVPLADAGAD